MITRIGQLISHAALHRPGAAAIIEAQSGRMTTYGELDRKVGIMAAYLCSKGVVPGDRVGLLSGNSAGFIAAYFAVSRAGAVPVPLNITLREDALIRQAKICGIRAIYHGRLFADRAAAVASAVSSVRFLFDDASGPRSGGVREGGGGGAPATIIFTSGTKGEPLGVMLSHRNILSNAAAVAAYTGLCPSDRILCVLPLYYIYGLSTVFSHFYAGGTVIIENRFAYPNIALDSIERFRATGFAGVSSHYSILVNHSDIRSRKLRTLRYMMQAGDAMPATVTRSLVRLLPGKKLYLMYGQTEAGPRLAYLEPRLAAAKPDSVGKAVPGVTIKIAGKRGECAPWQVGEITARGDNIMMGYWRNKRATAKALKNGWLHAGDMGYKDDDGDIFITGRLSGLVKIGGQKADPFELERVAAEYEGVAEAAAVPVPDRLLGNRLHLFVSPVAGAKIDGKALKDHCVRRLADYGRAVDVSVRASLPRTGCGKIDKNTLEGYR
jgi:acyl-CoA synthetase (AMP-forming)/AMP-acid ligase II